MESTLAQKIAEGLKKEETQDLSTLLRNAIEEKESQSNTCKLQINVNAFLEDIMNEEGNPFLFVTKEEIKMGGPIQAIDKLFKTVNDLLDANIDSLNSGVFDNLFDFDENTYLEFAYIDLYQFDSDLEIEWIFN